MITQKKMRLGELLVKQNIITEKQLDIALDKQIETDEKIGQILITLGFINEKTLYSFLSQQLNLPITDLSQVKIDLELVQFLPENIARRAHAILLEEKDGKFLVGLSDPLDIVAIDELSQTLPGPFETALVQDNKLLALLDLIYRRTGDIQDYAQELGSKLGDVNQQNDLDTLEETDTKSIPVVNLLRSLFKDAVQVNASDIHIEPGKNFLRIRLRVDGMLQEQIIDEPRIASALNQRLKLMAKLNIAEKRLPQDGRFTVKIQNIPIDVRLSTMPTQYGETIVMRLLKRSNEILTLSQIGMTSDTLSRFEKLIHATSGIIIVSGPTGSGKSTTLYAVLNQLNDIKRKIISIEDPIEYTLDRINQVQINNKLGLHFSTVLRTSLRHDPDIILVGEIRDKETALIATRAALTGHLVLATLHTNDAETTAIRLMDMGVDNYLISSVIRGSLAQRLIRKICPNCTKPHTPTEEEKIFIQSALGQTVALDKLQIGAGCEYCHQTGYKGRIGIYSLLTFDNKLRETLRQKNISGYFKVTKSDKNLKSLYKNGMEAVTQGISTVEEVRRVVEEIVD